MSWPDKAFIEKVILGQPVILVRLPPSNGWEAMSGR
jgi:hypothetical protein